MKKLTLILSFCLAAIFAQAQQATEATVRELLAATGSADMGKQVMDNLFAQFRKDIKDDRANTFFEKMAAEINTNTLREMIIPVYQKNYTEQDLRAAIDYYKTPFGQKMLAKNPVVIQESMEIGQKWGREIAEKVADRMEKEGLMKSGAVGASEAELEMARADSIAVAQEAQPAVAAPTTQTTAEQTIEDNFMKEMEAADRKCQINIEKVMKKRQKALAKLKK